MKLIQLLKQDQSIYEIINKINELVSAHNKLKYNNPSYKLELNKLSEIPYDIKDSKLKELKEKCCEKCWNSKYALRGKNKLKFGCGLSCKCHVKL